MITALRGGWLLYMLLILSLTAPLDAASRQTADESTAGRVDSLWTIAEVLKDANGDGKVDALGRRVRVAGRANVSSGVYHERYLQIFIQNDSLGLSLFRESIRQPVEPGDSLVVVGKVQEYFGMAEVAVDHYLVYSLDKRKPEPVPLGLVQENPSRYIGRLTSGTGVVVGKGDRYNGKYLVLSISSDTEKSLMVYVSNFHRDYQQFNFDHIAIGDRLDVTGVINYDQADESGRPQFPIFLRTPQDLQVIGISWYYLRIVILAGIFVMGVVIAWSAMLRRQVKKQTREIRETLNEKETLLQEIHHRVKNNLAVISGLIELQLDTTEDETSRQALRDSQTRIQSMAMVHEKLYQSESLAQISMEAYLRELVDTIHHTFSNESREISYEVDVEPVNMELEQAIPCGLLINELVVNVYKHAFRDESTGYYYVGFRKIGEQVELQVKDDGPGLPEDFDPDAGSSLGMSLIDTFVSQLNGELEVNNGNGADFTIRFRI